MKKYCESIAATKRWKTREVLVGHVGVGGNNRVRIQSMTTSNTREVEATISEVMQLADAGCEIVRMTVQGIKEAKAAEDIKNGLLQKGYNTPLVADIHFFPPAAMHVIDFVEKVRINPGNYVDKRASFKTISYDDVSYAEEIEKIEERFAPLVEKCKRLKKAMRIGVNHGSLSDRIMSRYGDTPLGMVESALEFARVCRKYDYHSFVFSMKSSNPRVMILAYRLLVSRMIELGWDYPLHLGVTEAGQGDDGRVKSAIGIGSLLLDGIGDTIRVSLTEDPWHEIDPCRRLIQFASAYEKSGSLDFEEHCRAIESMEKRPVVFRKNISFHSDGTVIVSPKPEEQTEQDLYKAAGCSVQFGKPKLAFSSADCLVFSERPKAEEAWGSIKHLNEIGMTSFSCSFEHAGMPSIRSLKEIVKDRLKASFDVGLSTNIQEGIFVGDEPPGDWPLIETLPPSVIFLSPTKDRLHYARRFFDWLKLKKIATPVILAFEYSGSKEELVIEAAAECGALLCDGLGEGIWIRGDYDTTFLRELSFNILQAARMRAFKTEFISCPSCGRTLFDLQDVSKRIREKTSHLPGVKIAIMGCIVNGPGEMADADFGYVGSKPEKIDLYVGKHCVEKDIGFEEADERLIALIKKHGRWIDSEEAEKK